MILKSLYRRFLITADDSICGNEIIPIRNAQRDGQYARTFASQMSDFLLSKLFNKDKIRYSRVKSYHSAFIIQFQ